MPAWESVCLPWLHGLPFLPFLPSLPWITSLQWLPCLPGLSGLPWLLCLPCLKWLPYLVDSVDRVDRVYSVYPVFPVYPVYPVYLVYQATKLLCGISCQYAKLQPAVEHLLEGMQAGLILYLSSPQASKRKPGSLREQQQIHPVLPPPVPSPLTDGSSCTALPYLIFFNRNYLCWLLKSVKVIQSEYAM